MGRLTIAEGPDRVGEQLILTGREPIGIGSSAENAIVLSNDDVPPQAARLVPIGNDWRLDDLSGAGLFVNDEVTSARDLQTGDVVRIGPYELEYTGAAQHAVAAAAPERSAAVGLAQSFSTPPPSQQARINCPSCGQALPLGAKLCVDCGIDLQTGRRLLTSQEVDENTLYARADTAIRVVSWILPFGVYPIASEGLGSRKPFVTWLIALATVVLSLSFLSRNLGVPAEERNDRALVLWVEGTSAETSAVHPSGKPAPAGTFHPSQVITYAFLHDSLLVLIVNAAFLLVLGSRVNALIGNVRTAIVYPLLVVVMALVYLGVGSHDRPQGISGASGAVMGLAGIYLVLFPIHRVHMAAWVRTGPSTGFRLAHNVFAVGGVWVVVICMAVDALMTLLDNPYHATAWAHFLGLPIGIALGLALLIARQVNAHGADLISVTLGRRAWILLGRPGQRAAE
ncbi:MAG TPA: rhomboid family intramembrane serine protease [Tepidisphaeraceae bacterium]